MNDGPSTSAARLLQQVDRRPDLAAVRARPGLAREHAHLELDRAGRDDGRERVRELVDRGVVVAPLDSASARVRIASARARSSLETPLSRNERRRRAGRRAT